MPSNDWAVPNAAGQLACGAARQAAVLAAARVQRGEGGRTGGGAMLLCLAGSSHNTFAGGWGAAGKRCTFIGNLMPFCAAIEPSPLSALSALPCRAPCPPSQTFCRCLRAWLAGCWRAWVSLPAWTRFWAFTSPASPCCTSSGGSLGAALPGGCGNAAAPHTAIVVVGTAPLYRGVIPRQLTAPRLPPSHTW